MAFVFNIFIGYQINHFTEAAAYSVAVGLVEFGAVEVGGDVGEHSMFDEEVVAGKEDLCHDVAVVAEVFEGVFGSQVVKAVSSRLTFVIVVPKGLVAVFFDDGVSFANELERDLSAGDHDVVVVSGSDETKEGHEGCFAATDGTREQNALAEADAQLIGIVLVFHEVDEEFEDYEVVFFVDAEVLTVEPLSGVLEDGEAFGEGED